MIITETITLARANTSIVWPEIMSANNVADPNSPTLTTEPLITTDVSDDLLTKRTIRVWTSKEDFVAVHAYAGSDANAYFDSIASPGITHTRIITTE